jgi:hypothetical protein
MEQRLTPYQRVLFFTFPRSRADALSMASHVEVEAAAPKPFAEVFADTPANAARPSIAAAILGPFGIAALVVALVIGAVQVDHALVTQPSLEMGTITPQKN